MSDKIDQFDDGVGSLVEDTLPAEPPRIAGTDDSGPRLGPFDLEEQVGEGGSGVVWRGRHRDQDVPVAVKFITKLGSDPEGARRRFRSEVRSVAALNHPGIVTILDYGEVPAELAHRMGGRIPSGIPYMVTEFARTGTLLPFIGELDWPFCRALLLSLLDALAHAHARGVFHRDIKPTNVLLDQGPTPDLSTVSHTDLEGDALRVKLTDFGIALQRDRVLDPASEVAATVEGEGAVGTPYYMAPEQLQARWRDYGPWTDLYALGCMAWQLITGHRPFSGESMMSVARAQLVEPLPAFEPIFEVPDRLENWLATLLQKRPDHRFQNAADAALCLASLKEAERHDGEAGATVRLPDRLPQTPDASFPAKWAPTLETLKLDLHQTTGELDLPAGFPTPDDLESADVHRPPLRRRRPPLPKHWARQCASQPPLAVVGAGLRLFGLRELPVVGHREARDRLWSKLGEAIGFGERGGTDEKTGEETGSPRLVLLHGPAGIGKSRLARWLVHRAGEVGAADAMRASHERAGHSPLEALRAMVDRYLGCVGLSHEETRSRIATWYERRDIAGREDETHYEVDALASLLAPEDDHEIRLQEAFGVLQGFVQRAARHDRPLILHLDDVHWGRETLEWTRRLLTGPGGADTGAPILMVATYRDESLAERPREAELVEALADHASVSSLQLDPLGPRHLRKLLESGLRLKPELAFKVLDRADGNPLFATQLVQTWADRRLLEVGDGGFRLAESAEELLPDDLYAVWSERLDRALGDTAREQYRDQYVALELGATLGREPRREEWQAACQRAGVPFPEALVERLLKNRLMEDTDEGWRFAHNMLRETLERHARRGGRWRRHNRACADVVRVLDGGSGALTPDHSQRLAEFLLEAQDWEAAIEPLLEAIEHHGRMGRLDGAGYLLERLEEAKDRAELPETDERVARYHLRKGRVLLSSHDLQKARAHFRAALDWSRRQGTGADVRARAHFGLSRISYLMNEPEQAAEHLRAAMEATSPEDVLLKGRILREMGVLARDYPDMGPTREYIERSISLLEGRPLERAKAETELAGLLAESGDATAAERLYGDALRRFRGEQHLSASAKVLNSLANLRRRQGDLSEALERVREAEELARTVDSFGLTYIRLTIAELEIARGHPERAGWALSQLPEELPDTVERVTLTYRAVVAAEQGDWQTTSTQLDALWKKSKDRQLEGSGELTEFLERLIEILKDAGRTGLLSRARRILAASRVAR